MVRDATDVQISSRAMGAGFGEDGTNPSSAGRYGRRFEDSGGQATGSTGVPANIAECRPGTDAIASFSRDGKWIYFTSNRTGRYELWKMPADGGQPIQVTTNGGYVAFESIDGQTLYFTKEQGGALWQMPAGGAAESKVLDQVAGRNFMPTRDGIYFMHRSDAVHSVQFLNFATGQVQTLGSMTISDALPYAADPSNGLTVSPDGRWLAYVQQDHAGSDIVLVENFR